MPGYNFSSLTVLFVVCCFEQANYGALGESALDGFPMHPIKALMQRLGSRSALQMIGETNKFPYLAY